MKRRNFLQASGLSVIPAVISPLGLFSQPVEKKNKMNSSQKKDEHEFFYKPVDGWLADVIPFYANGEFYLFYLHDWRNKEKHGAGIPWYLIKTKDFVNFTELGEVIKRGTEKDQDLFIFTGSIIEAAGQYHTFYTGHNPSFKDNPAQQAIMHATSNDLINWVKVPEHTFYAPDDTFEKNDWRDPYVFWNEESDEYNMLLAARNKEGIPRMRGITAICTSKDLITWEISRKPFYAPDLFYTHECPDLFKMGDWWYFVFSEFLDLFRTRYRMSRSLNGPWITPKNDDFDGRAFYAAKTATDGERRYLFGWNGTRQEEKDHNSWQWGGNLVVHELRQEKNGELTVCVPETVVNTFNHSTPLDFSLSVGNVSSNKGIYKINAFETFGASLAGKMPDQCMINATVQFEKGTKELGLIVRGDKEFDKGYYIRLEPQKNRLVFDRRPRKPWGVSHWVELEREIVLKPETPVRLQIFIDRSVGVVYVDNKIAMNFRAYDFPEGNWGIFASNGSAKFQDVQISTRS